MSEDSGKALVPTEEKIVEVYGDKIKGVRVTRTPSGATELKGTFSTIIQRGVSFGTPL